MPASCIARRHRSRDFVRVDRAADLLKLPAPGTAAGSRPGGMSEPMPCETNDLRRAAASRFGTLTPLIAPRLVAILGASNDPVRIGGRPIAYMKAQNFSGEVFPVN